jgi:hypothetical protein
MTSWREVEADAPEFAARVRALFRARDHMGFGEELTIGTRTGAEVGCDSQLVLHSPSVDAPENDEAWPGEAKIVGRVVTTERGLCLEITEVALTHLDAGLVIESWHPGRGLDKHVLS